MKDRWESVIGLEIHVQLNSESKIFSSPSKPNPSFPENPTKVAACSPNG